MKKGKREKFVFWLALISLVLSILAVFGSFTFVIDEGFPQVHLDLVKIVLILVSAVLLIKSMKN